MKRQTILAATRKEQMAWLETTDPDYGRHAYQPELLFDVFYPHRRDWREDLRRTHGEGLGEYLEGIGEPIDQACIARVLQGGPVSSEETQAILDYVAEEDADTWVSLVGWDAACEDGQVFVLCLGKSIGQGGTELELIGIYPTREAADEGSRAIKLLVAGMTGA